MQGLEDWRDALGILSVVIAILAAVVYVFQALSCLDVRPLIKGYFSALRWSWVRSCLRPLARRIESAGPDVVR